MSISAPVHRACLLRAPRACRRRSLITGVLTLTALLAVPLGAAGQQRPLVTEDPETIGAGRLLLEAGIDYARDARFPVSGLEGHQLRVPTLGVSIGISSIAEIQIDGGVYTRLSITARDPAAPLAGMVTAEGDSTSSVEDLVIGTKVRVVAEGDRRPSVGLRFATRLPNASNESGLGLDTTDFYASMLLAKTVESVRVVGNVGFGILGDPTRGDRQNDVLTYGVSFARALTFSTEVVGEVNGRLNVREGTAPPGTETRGTLRLGARYTVSTLRVDGAVLFGVTGDDPGVGVTARLTYVFNAFAVP
jgi:hypothetical protein